MTYTYRRAWPIKLILATLVLPLVFLLAVPTVYADEHDPPPGAGSQPEAADADTVSRSGGLSIVPACATGSELPQLDCVLLTLGNIAQLILALTGGLALLMFVYGGFLMLSSGGSSEKVGQGKNALKAAVTGIVIVLLAGYLIRWGLSSLDVDPEGFQKVKASSEESAPDDSDAGDDAES